MTEYLRPFDVSAAMFIVSQYVARGEPVPPEIMVVVFKYVEKLEADLSNPSPTEGEDGRKLSDKEE